MPQGAPRDAVLPPLFVGVRRTVSYEIDSTTASSTKPVGQELERPAIPPTGWRAAPLGDQTGLTTTVELGGARVGRLPRDQRRLQALPNEVLAHALDRVHPDLDGGSNVDIKQTRLVRRAV